MPFRPRDSKSKDPNLRVASEGLSEQQVLDYLRAHPDFFQQHATAIAELSLSHETGNAVSLIEHQVAILRERNMTMRRRMNELLQAARSNDEIFAKTRSLNLALLEVNSWHELNEVLATHVLVDFEADFVCAHLAAANLVLALDHMQHHIEQVPCLHLQSGSDATCTVLRKDELHHLFPMSDHDETGSAVLLQLKVREGSGVLCIGSRSPTRFAKNMDTLFVQYIADILAKVMNRLSA
ncbi:MAG TPA: hypothetical protein DHU16_06490 [Gammaproteobacteria bacterium]|nr:hypothetical protein [Gammaproteobacteria bacterium]